MKIFLLLLSLQYATILSAKKVVLPFEYHFGVIFLNVKINNSASLLFLFDTGANTSAIDNKASEKLALPIIRKDSVEGTAGTIPVLIVKVNSLSAGNARVQDLALTKQDLSYSLAPPGKSADGILGTDFMKHFVISIDFQLRQISFSKKIKHNHNGISFEMDNDIPTIQCSINGSFKTPLRYDSGSSLFQTDSTYINVTTDNWLKIQQLDTSLRISRYFRGYGIGGELKLAVIEIKSLSINQKKIKSPFIIVQPKQGYFARENAVGFFGNNLVDKFERVTIDFQEKKIYLSTNKTKR
jgi:hypothetical protein